MKENRTVDGLLVLVLLGMLLLAVIAKQSTATPVDAADSSSPYLREIPAVNIPQALRVSNWSAWDGEGSCAHAAIAALLNWQGQYDVARWWTDTYSGGETPAGLAAKANAIGLDFAETTDGDESFLEWAVNTRRGAVVAIRASYLYPDSGGYHAVCLVHMDAKDVGLLDNNDTRKIVWKSRDGFLREWQSNYWRWAVTPVYNPPPKLPWVGDQ